MKLLNNICDQMNKDNNTEDDVGVGEEFDLSQEVKQIQTILYQLWLRLLEWECLLEQQLRGPASLDQVEVQSEEEEEEVRDSNDEEMLRTPAENVSERTVESFTRSHPSSSPSSSPSPSPSTPSPCPSSVSPGDRGSSC